jgi:hypothetical protein
MATVNASGDWVPEAVETKWHEKTRIHREFDRSVRAHNRVNLALGVAGIAVSFLALELRFVDGSKEGRDTAGSFACKIVSSLLTLALLTSIVAYYFRHARARGSPGEWYVDDTAGWTRWWKVFFAAELAVCAVHPPPLGVHSAADSRCAVMAGDAWGGGNL